MKWQPIETAPKDGTEILICDPSEDEGGMFVVAWGIPSIHSPDPNIEKFGEATWCIPGWGVAVEGDHGEQLFCACAWMSLPELPVMSTREVEEIYSIRRGHTFDAAKWEAEEREALGAEA